jgi:hypothetical protein
MSSPTNPEIVTMATLGDEQPPIDLETFTSLCSRQADLTTQEHELNLHNGFMLIRPIDVPGFEIIATHPDRTLYGNTICQLLLWHTRGEVRSGHIAHIIASSRYGTSMTYVQLHQTTRAIDTICDTSNNDRYRDISLMTRIPLSIENLSGDIIYERDLRLESWSLVHGPSYQRIVQHDGRCFEYSDPTAPVETSLMSIPTLASMSAFPSVDISSQIPARLDRLDRPDPSDHSNFATIEQTPGRLYRPDRAESQTRATYIGSYDDEGEPQSIIFPDRPAPTFSGQIRIGEYYLRQDEIQNNTVTPLNYTQYYDTEGNPRSGDRAVGPIQPSIMISNTSDEPRGIFNTNANLQRSAYEPYRAHRDMYEAYHTVTLGLRSVTQSPVGYNRPSQEDLTLDDLVIDAIRHGPSGEVLDGEDISRDLDAIDLDSFEEVD